MVAGKQQQSTATSQDPNKRLKSHPFFERVKKNYGIGGLPRMKEDLTFYVRWPKCVKLQRKRAILLRRLKAPAPIRLFRDPVTKNEASAAFKLLSKYRPETPEQKRARLVSEAEARVEGEEKTSKRPMRLRVGINDVTAAIEQKKAKLVVIAHDVDPIELVIWLPALCKKMEVPFMIVKGRARLGTLVHQKNCAVVALENVRKEDVSALDQLVKSCQA